MSYCTVPEVAAALRIAVTPDNTSALQACIDAAAFEIDDAIDREAETVDVAAWHFDDSTQAADPGPGNLRLDHFNPAATEHLFVSTTDLLAQVQVDPHAVPPDELRPGDVLRLYDGESQDRWEQFTVAGAVVDYVSWVDVPVERTAFSDVRLDLVDGMQLNVPTLRLTPLVAGQLALANRVNVLRAVEWWKANDAAIGAVGFDQSGALQVPRSTFSLRHGGTVTPLKQRFGIA